MAGRGGSLIQDPHLSVQETDEKAIVGRGQLACEAPTGPIIYNESSCFLPDSLHCLVGREGEENGP